MKMVVNSAVYGHGKKLRDIEIDKISQALETPDTFVWIGLHEPSEAILKQLQEQLNLHDLAIEDAHNAHQRPKVEEYGNSLFVALRTAEMVDNDVCLGETHILVGPRYVISVRHGSLLPYTSVRAKCENLPDLLNRGPAFVLYALMDFIVDHYFPIVDSLEIELEEAEEAVFRSSSIRNTTERIYNIKRDLMALKKSVYPLIGVCRQLTEPEMPLIPEDIRPYFRDIYDHLSKINDAVENMREMVATVFQAHLSLISVGQNEDVKKLAGWAAIIAVPTMVAGIYGMNFEFMPELKWKFGYPLVVGIIAITCVYLYSRFKRSGWL